MHSVLVQQAVAEFRPHFGGVLGRLSLCVAKAAASLRDTAKDVLAFTQWPKDPWRPIWSGAPQARLEREIRRRTVVVGIFPNRDAIIRLAGAVHCEMNDDGATVRCTMSFDVSPKDALLALSEKPKARLRRERRLAG